MPAQTTPRVVRSLPSARSWHRRAGRDTATRAEALFLRALPKSRQLADLRPMASVALGCDAAATTRLGDVAIAAEREVVGRLSARLAPVAGSAWPWPDPILTYESLLVAQAMIRGGLRLHDRAAVEMGIGILSWYVTAAETDGGTLSFVGNDGWWARDGARARFDQQPIEASSTFLACEAAADATGDDRYRELMGRRPRMVPGRQRSRHPCRPAARRGVPRRPHDHRRQRQSGRRIDPGLAARERAGSTSLACVVRRSARLRRGARRR